MIRTRHIGATLLIVLFGGSGALAQAPAAADKAEALSEATRKGDAAAVKKLLDEGVDVNTKYRYDRTALSFACDRGHVEVVKVLLDRGADVNVKDTFYGATALSWASRPAMGRKPQHAEIVGLLLARGAQGKEGALMAAVGAPDVAMTKVIVESGGLSADALTNALEAAKRNKRDDIVALLEKAGAKPRVELKLEPAQLARYVGAYRSPNESNVTVAVNGERLALTIGGQRLTLVARDPTTFGVVEQPITTVTFKVEQEKVTAVTLSAMGNSITFTRAEDK